MEEHKGILDRSLEFTKALGNGDIIVKSAESRESEIAQEGFIGRLWQVPYLAFACPQGSRMEKILGTSGTVIVNISKDLTVECEVSCDMTCGDEKLFYLKALSVS